jgi:hypothetical protein
MPEDFLTKPRRRTESGEALLATLWQPTYLTGSCGGVFAVDEAAAAA